jgi:hypothetical protein
MTLLNRGERPIPAPPHPASENGRTPSHGSAIAIPPTVVREASAPRRWTVKGLALAVICVVLGGLVTMVGVESFSVRHSVLVFAKPIPIGSTIGTSDITTARITSDPNLKSVPATDLSSVVGKVALVDLRAGTLVTLDELGTSDGFTAGQVLVGLALKAGQFPARGVSAGESVMIVATPGGASGSSTQGSSSTTASPTEAVVSEVGTMDPTSGITVIDVRVPTAAGVPLAQLAATGNVTLILLPAGR